MMESIAGTAKPQAVEELVLWAEGEGLVRTIGGTVRAWHHDHPEVRVRTLPSLQKRIIGQVRTRIHELLGLRGPARFDPWRQHCPSCQCEQETRGRVAEVAT